MEKVIFHYRKGYFSLWIGYKGYKGYKAYKVVIRLKRGIAGVTPPTDPKKQKGFFSNPNITQRHGVGMIIDYF